MRRMRGWNWEFAVFLALLLGYLASVLQAYLLPEPFELWLLPLVFLLLFSLSVYLLIFRIVWQNSGVLSAERQHRRREGMRAFRSSLLSVMLLCSLPLLGVSAIVLAGSGFNPFALEPLLALLKNYGLVWALWLLPAMALSCLADTRRVGLALLIVFLFARSLAVVAFGFVFPRLGPVSPAAYDLLWEVAGAVLGAASLLVVFLHFLGCSVRWQLAVMGVYLLFFGSISTNWLAHAMVPFAHPGAAQQAPIPVTLRMPSGEWDGRSIRISDSTRCDKVWFRDGGMLLSCLSTATDVAPVLLRIEEEGGSREVLLEQRYGPDSSKKWESPARLNLLNEVRMAEPPEAEAAPRTRRSRTPAAAGPASGAQ